MPRRSQPIRREDVESLVSLDPETGALTWLPRTARDFDNSKAEAFCKTWNKRFAGKPALSTIGHDGYARGYLNGRMTLAHRVVFALAYGCCSGEVDHVDGDRSNNKPENLRASNPTSNNRNLAKPRNNTSGIIGVYTAPDGHWRAAISINGKQKHIGNFQTKQDAADARKKAELELGYHPNHGREK